MGTREPHFYFLLRNVAPVRIDRLNVDRKSGIEALEGFAYANAPGMTFLALGKVNAEIYVILLA